MHSKNVIKEGKPLTEAKKVLILLHGRGGNARDILSLAPRLNAENYALLAPEATNNTWYPYSFMAPEDQNEPWLSSALDVVNSVVADVYTAGFTSENIYFLGFSQGACLTLEFVARNAGNYGGVAAFTGALIGERLKRENYKGDFKGTPVFIGTGNPDAHVPVKRVQDSAKILEEMNAEVKVNIYDDRPHTISAEEIEQVNSFIFK